MTNTDTKCKIRRMESSDVAAVAAVHTQSLDEVIMIARDISKQKELKR